MSYNMTGGADKKQQGDASDMRNKVWMDKDDYSDLCKVVHSSDKVGKHSKTPNEYRDHDSKYDPEAQKVLDRVHNKYGL